MEGVRFGGVVGKGAGLYRLQGFLDFPGFVECEFRWRAVFWSSLTVSGRKHAAVPFIYSFPKKKRFRV